MNPQDGEMYWTIIASLAALASAFFAGYTWWDSGKSRKLKEDANTKLAEANRIAGEANERLEKANAIAAAAHERDLRLERQEEDAHRAHCTKIIELIMVETESIKESARRETRSEQDKVHWANYLSRFESRLDEILVDAPSTLRTEVRRIDVSLCADSRIMSRKDVDITMKVYQAKLRELNRQYGNVQENA